MIPRCHLCRVEVDKTGCSDWFFVFRKTKDDNRYDGHYYCDMFCFMDSMMNHLDFDKLFVQTSDGFVCSVEDMYNEIGSKNQ